MLKRKIILELSLKIIEMGIFSYYVFEELNLNVNYRKGGNGV